MSKSPEGEDNERALQDLREVRQRLPEVEDIAPQPEEPTDTGRLARLSPALKQIRLAAIRVRWRALAILAAILLSYGGAVTAAGVGQSEAQRWAMSMLGVIIVLAAATLFDTTLQFPERARFLLVEQQEARFLSQATENASRMLSDQ